MSRLFGPLRQMGFVVRDIDKAMRHWVEVCGVGPWYIAERLPLHGFWYKEQRFDDIHLTIALANSGEVQLELIQQRDDTPSMYRDFLAAGHEGLQHWSSWPENYHELLDRAVANGWTIGQREPAGSVRVFSERGPSRHRHRNGRADADPAPDFRRRARSGDRLGRKRSDPPRLAARLSLGAPPGDAQISYPGQEARRFPSPPLGAERGKGSQLAGEPAQFVHALERALEAYLGNTFASIAYASSSVRS
jgi:Glyoxalase/Bleomycin resistance protein/Dioxygenase superfamily